MYMHMPCLGTAASHLADPWRGCDAMMRGIYLALSCIVSRLRTMVRAWPGRGRHVLDCEGSSSVVCMRDPSVRLGIPHTETLVSGSPDGVTQ